MRYGSIFLILKGKQSLFFETYPGIIETDKNVLNKIDRLTEIKKEVNKALELARIGKLIGHPLDARVDLYLKKDDKKYDVLDEGIEKLFIVSELCVNDLMEQMKIAIPQRMEVSR